MIDLPFELATCSFSEFQPDMGHPVRIARGFPRYPLKYRLRDSYTPFTPGADYLYVKSDEVFYRRLREQLEATGLARMVRQLTTIAEVNDADTLVLLCFEKLNKRDDCHRTYIGQWWEEQTGHRVEELGATKTRPGPPPPGQSPLFDL